jgi:hypothetical protein
MTAPTRIMPATIVPAQHAQAPKTGLLSLANKPDLRDIDGSPTRWEGGYSYRPELPVGTARNRSLVTSTVGGNVGTGSNPAPVDTIPWMLELLDPESTFTWTAHDLAARGNRLLEAYTSKLLERELWTGEIKAADNLPNRVLARPITGGDILTGATDVTPGVVPTSVQAAVATLMKALGDAGMGDGMIHAPKHLGLRMPDAWRNAQTYEDYGFVVVTGAGYPGTGPAGTGTNWMYVTETVNVRLGDIEVTPGEVRESINTTSNTITYRARRVGAVDFAGPVFACQVNP